MALTPGTRLGVYEVTAQIGEGGMGQVYRATDRTLGRQVAIKILPDAFASDPERLARFEREAKTLASLNHPNIATIYGFEKSAGVHALVMELVEGDDLSQRIARGAIPVDEALPIAKQIAEALEVAHEQGIIHRDLKPANIKVRDDGTVKVLDFGLAKAFQSDVAAADVSQSPTLSVAATRMGVILGTAAYMSPEQARGKAVDKRTDIWAFGVVLYEMLTGNRAFDGEDVTDVLSRVLQRDPDFNALPATTPPAMRKLLRRCLEKNHKGRLRDVGDALVELKEAQTAPTGEAVVPLSPPHVPKWRRALAPTLTFLAGGLVAGTAVWLTTRPAPPRVTRTMITPSATVPLAIDGVTRDLAIAPDGTRVVYIVANGTQLVVRALDQLAATTISGITPRHPFFSPDGQWIGFFDGVSLLKKVATSGGPALTLSRVSAAPRGASWGPDDRIVFATSDATTGLLRVGATGGEPEVLTTPDQTQGEVDHLWPEAMAGGEAVLFTITTTGGTERAQVGLLDLRTREKRVLLRRGSHAQYVAPGYLVYGVEGTLWAVAFNLGRREVVGAPVPVVEGVVTTPLGAADVSISVDGTMVYVPAGQTGAQRTPVWVDRQGLEEPIPAPPRAYTLPRLSPDGTKVALDVRDQELDISIWDLTRATLTRLTFDPGLDRFPVWTPDGRRIAFASDQAGATNVFRQAADGTGAVERLSESPNIQFPYGFTPDGTRLVVRETGSGTGGDLALLTLDKDPRVVPLVQTAFDEQNGEISPDGRWLAYESDEPGQAQIYVRPFPAVDQGRWQVSTGGGTEPLWARSGRELFYRASDGTLMGVAVTVQGATSFTWGTPAKLVEGRYFAGGGVYSGRTYDASPDGKRFLMIKEGGGADETAAPPSIVVVQHWVEELKRLVPAN